MIISKERNSLPGRKYFISGLNREFFMVPAVQMLAVYRQLSVGEKDLIHDVVKLLQGYEVKRK